MFNPYRHRPIKKFSQREKNVIHLSCEQKTNRVIAKQLKLNTRTIESHREKIQEKTGAKSLVGVVIYEIRHMYKV